MVQMYVIRRTTSQTFHGKKIADSFVMEFFFGCPCFTPKVNEARKYETVKDAEKDRNRISGWDEHEDICKYTIEEVKQ